MCIRDRWKIEFEEKLRRPTVTKSSNTALTHVSKKNLTIKTIAQKNKSYDYETKNTHTIRVKVTNSVGSELEETFSILITDDTSDNCDPSLSYSGDINSFGSLRVNQTDSLNPSETDYKIIALPFEGYSLSNLTSNMRTDQYMLKQWNGTAYSSAAGSSSIGKGYMFLSTLRPSQIELSLIHI